MLLAPRSSFPLAGNNWQHPETDPLDAPSSPPAPFPRPNTTKRKRLPDSKINKLEDVNHSIQPRELPPSKLPEEILPKDSGAEAKIDEPEGVHSSKHARELSPLSEEDLHALYKEVMDYKANHARIGSIKRCSSRHSTTASSNLSRETTRTKGTSSTNANYRFEVFVPAQINIYADPPPKHIQDAIDAIVYAKPSEKRRHQLELIARKFQGRCIERARGSVGENDFVKILHDAIDAMHFDILCLRTNAD